MGLVVQVIEGEQVARGRGHGPAKAIPPSRGGHVVLEELAVSGGQLEVAIEAAHER